MAVGLGASRAHAGTRLTVHAGDADRVETPVSFKLPDTVRGVNALKAPGEPVIPLQVDPDGQATFILPRLAGGESKTFELITAMRAAVVGEIMEAKATAGAVEITWRGKRVLRYNTEPTELPRPDIKPIYRRGGYLHPIFTPGGRVVTDDYPPNHVHHHGVWFAWTNTEFERRKPDFWNMGQGKGTVDFVALDATWSGPVHAGFRSRHRFVDLTAEAPKTALHEVWDVRAYHVGSGQRQWWMFDLVSTQTCASASPLKLPEYYYGGLGLRGRWEWNGETNCFFLTANGETDRVKGHATRANWCHLGGWVEGELAGIAVLCHPQNFRAPQPMRIHPREPFFCYAPSQIGDLEITPGQPYVSRYRFVVSDGPPDRAALDRLWKDYAEPPRVVLE